MSRRPSSIRIDSPLHPRKEREMTSLQKAVEMMNIEVPDDYSDYSLAQWQESLRPGSVPVQAADLGRDSNAARPRALPSRDAVGVHR